MSTSKSMSARESDNFLIIKTDFTRSEQINVIVNYRNLAYVPHAVEYLKFGE